MALAKLCWVKREKGSSSSSKGKRKSAFSPQLKKLLLILPVSSNRRFIYQIYFITLQLGLLWNVHRRSGAFVPGSYTMTRTRVAGCGGLCQHSDHLVQLGLPLSPCERTFVWLDWTHRAISKSPGSHELTRHSRKMKPRSENSNMIYGTWLVLGSCHVDSNPDSAVLTC